MIAHCDIKASKRRHEGNSRAVSSPLWGRFVPFLPIMDAPLLWTQQSVSNPVQVRQRKQRVHLRQILRDSAVAHLRVTPQALDHQERMLDNGTDPRQAPVAKALRLGQRTVLGAALVDVELNSVCLGLRLECLGVVGRIAMQTLLASVQELAQHVHIGHVRPPCL